MGQRARDGRKDHQGLVPKVGDNTLYIETDSPWENGYRESFNG